MSFRISGLPATQFAHWFDLDDAGLAQRHALRRIVDKPRSFPCRISLTDAEIGQHVLLINYEHQPAASPFRASHAIYIRAGETTFDAVACVPDMLRTRLLSLRGFDSAGMLTQADVVDGRELEKAIDTMFAVTETSYIHAHFARPGCYAARIDRT